MGILESIRADFFKAASELTYVQEELDLKPLDNEALWEKEFALILEVNKLYKEYLKELDRVKDIVGEEAFKKLRLEAYNMATSGRPYAN